MPVKIATNIETEKWNNILEYLISENWVIANEYPDIFDKGIDYDFYTLKKNNETIELGWTNWFEGEIKSNETKLYELATKFQIDLEFNNPEFLSLNIMEKINNYVQHYI